MNNITNITDCEELKRCASKFIYMDGYKFTLDENTGYYRCDALRKRLHQYVWEKFKGNIEPGYHIHHINEDKTNNHITNLKKMEATEHLTWHGNNLTKEERQRLAENLKINARPKASEWHSSKEGSRWHKEHYERMKDKLHQRVESACLQCNKNFISTKRGRFCSNKCKSKWRREQGLDNVEKICNVCGNKFTTNKYSKAKFCSISCANVNRTKTIKEKASS